MDYDIQNAKRGVKDAIQRLIDAAYACGKQDGVALADKIAGWLTHTGPSDQALRDIRQWTRNLLQRHNMELPLGLKELTDDQTDGQEV